jgi:hypothetical protein
MKKKITIHKKHEIVRGTDDYSTMGKRALNTVYWAMQKHQMYKHDHMVIRFSTMRKMMNLESDQRYVETIKEALLELMQPMELNNFHHPIHDEVFQWYATSVLDEAGFKKNADKEWVVHIKVSTLVRYIMQLTGGFTPLELIPYANQFRTKYAMKLYEYLKSFGAYSYLDITQKHMMKLLALDEKSKYKYHSQLFELVERQTKEIAKKSDLQQVKLLKSKALAKDKTFRIIINPKSKKEADKTAAKTALENLVKRF